MAEVQLDYMKRNTNQTSVDFRFKKTEKEENFSPNSKIQKLIF